MKQADQMTWLEIVTELDGLPRAEPHWKRRRELEAALNRIESSRLYKLVKRQA